MKAGKLHSLFHVMKSRISGHITLTLRLYRLVATHYGAKYDVIYDAVFYSKLEYNKSKKKLNGGDSMPNIRPISDLRNYSDVLRDVSIGAPVFLTKNGRGRYAVIDIQEYEKTKDTLTLMNELAKGKKSGEGKGWLSSNDVRAHFRERANEE